MFERTFSFWRNLVGKPQASQRAAGAVEDDRRMWVRYASDLQGQVQLTEKQGSDKIQAHVRDLSVGGANLLVDRPLSPGHMLSLELPANKGSIRTVLACVVRAIPTEDGQWSLGCVFSRELDSDDLDSLGAKKVQAANEDQRIWVRFSCAVKARYRKFADPLAESRAVEVLDISASGIGLVVPSLDAGSLLTVDLQDKNGRKVCSILACVVHTTRRAGGDYAVGCNFIRELSEEELQSLL
jgi:c-di-GMP-binding flagellar brake protein YcgR